MTTSPDRRIADMDDGAPLPRQNGELVFEAPWEGRAFALAVALNEDGRYEWREFREHLIAEIAAAQASDAASSYYEQWLASVEKLAIVKGLIAPEELDRRPAEYASGERHDDGH